MKKANTNRWITVVVGVIIQLCSGVAYIWGVFAPGVKESLEWDDKKTQLAFALLLAMLTFGSMFGGFIARRFTPKAAIFTGGLVMGGGFFLASAAAAPTAFLVWIGYGILGGFGSGMMYSNVIAVTQKWFPDKRGLVTGLIIAGLGFSGIIFTPVAQGLVNRFDALTAFAFIGGLIALAGIGGSFFMGNPPADFIPQGYTPAIKPNVTRESFTPSEALKTPQIYMIIAAFMLATAAGFMVIPKAKELAIAGGMTPDAAFWGVMVVSFFNAVGRLVFGRVTDKLGCKKTLLFLLILCAVSIAPIALIHNYAVIALIALAGFVYGGFLGVFPVLSADYFGTKHGSIIYGMVMFGFSLGAVVFSYTVGYIKDAAGKLDAAFYIAAVAALVSAVIIAFLKPPAAIPGSEQ